VDEMNAICIFSLQNVMLYTAQTVEIEQLNVITVKLFLCLFPVIKSSIFWFERKAIYFS